MNTSTQYKRRNYFINKEFQGRAIFNYFVLASIGSILFIAVFSFFSSNTLSIVYDNYRLQIGLTPGILFKKILSTQWVFIVLGGGVVALVTLILTHRVAGPFYRFEKSLDNMVKGDISHKIILRKKDEGKDLAEKLNSFSQALGEKLSIIENYNAQIAISSLHLKKILDDSGLEGEKISPLLNEILDSQKNVQIIINGYTFPRKKF